MRRPSDWGLRLFRSRTMDSADSSESGLLLPHSSKRAADKGDGDALKERRMLRAALGVGLLFFASVAVAWSSSSFSASPSSERLDVQFTPGALNDGACLRSQEYCVVASHHLHIPVPPSIL